MCSDIYLSHVLPNTVGVCPGTKRALQTDIWTATSRTNHADVFLYFLIVHKEEEKYIPKLPKIPSARKVFRKS